MVSDPAAARSWPYTVRLPRGRTDHRARRLADGYFETACRDGGVFPLGRHLTRPLCYRPCRRCGQAVGDRLACSTRARTGQRPA